MPHPSSLASVEIGHLHLHLEGERSTPAVSLTTEEISPGLSLVHLEIFPDADWSPTPLKLSWRSPIVDTIGVWSSASDMRRGLTLPWEITVKSKATSQAPVVCLYGADGGNRMTFACSEVLEHIESTASVHEATGTFACHVLFFSQPTAPLRHYRATIRFDLRPEPFHQSLREVQEWWAGMPGITPSPVPDAARWPMYSTWYSFHQQMTDATVEEQCRLSKELGCEAVIIDDGWQTEDNAGGYAYCGEWEVYRGKFPDMAAHIARIHALGMKGLLWYSVPFIGFKSPAYQRFQGKFLVEIDNFQAAVLDPRFPEVREFLIGLYENAIREWDLDGLKLDFVDSFAPSATSYTDGVEGRDIVSVPDAVDRLMRDVNIRLRRIKPDIMIEFRQSYVGPLMRNYGNMFRAHDCPNDALTNRVRIVDVRLLAGNTAVHSDMLMWSNHEPVASAALQLLNILFSVPQVSVRIDQIPEDHRQMLAFWLGFWREHREVLLDGDFQPFHPEQFYPFVLARGASRWIGAIYGNIAAPLGNRLPDELWLVNATPWSRVLVELDTDSGSYHVEEYDVLGRPVESRNIALTPGLHSLKVGPSGLLRLRRS